MAQGMVAIMAMLHVLLTGFDRMLVEDQPAHDKHCAEDISTTNYGRHTVAVHRMDREEQTR